ncbi:MULTISPECIES: tail assembly protein [Rodentibacter]|uniref:Phage tail protein n=1 Tax=Rodentibacter genomosp. 2 TaxID=1908266 RepID=A0A1V3JH41_9PAST|nr:MULTISPECIES: tail assembly protein [Rodentibacter]OOF56131.1 phage tail protein [Rodentibacter genomosp. 2]OOF57130.1 phage tail protein [Rodentibacter genomosp. 2]THA16133.1 tail assembly protein [Rodentibacter pneumotropicus]
MVKVRFYGALKQFGTEFNLEVNNTAEIIRALTGQIPNLRQFLQQGLFKVRIGKDYLDRRYLEKGMFYQLKEGMSVCFTPVLKGAKRAGIFNIVVGAVLIAASWYAGGAAGWAYLGASGYGMATMAFMAGASMILSGVSQMLTKMPSMDIGKSESEKKNSTSFSSLSNMAAQGKPMPLAYGRIRTGSLIISQGIETMDVDVATPEQNSGRRRFRR